MAVTVRLGAFPGGSVSSPEWKTWDISNGVLTLYNDAVPRAQGVTTFAPGSWSYVHDLVEPPTFEARPAPIPAPPFQPEYEF